MKDKLRNFIESLFEDAPKNKQTIELKEEMLQNLIDKYNDLVDSGKVVRQPTILLPQVLVIFMN